jgi:hypothetical protein
MECTAIIAYSKQQPAAPCLSISPKKENVMGDKGGKKDKNKANKQKKSQVEKKKEEQKSKQPVKKAASAA